jgi:L-lactate dehydrogenase (cytochrome)
MINMATKPRWCLGMLGTQRREFGNIVGHVKGVTTWVVWANGRHSSSTPRLNWGDVEWIKKRWGGKLIIKGIQDVEDARLCVQRAPMH